MFRAFDAELGGTDRVIVNAASARGRPVGTGRPAVNLATAHTNFLGALAQCEAALEIFRRAGRGHLVLISSVRAVRGMAGSAAVYAASKAAVATLAEGLRLETAGTGIRVTTIYPGYIKTPMNEGIANGWAVMDLPAGARALARAIDREPATAIVPRWPWQPAALGLRLAPARVLARLAPGPG